MNDGRSVGGSRERVGSLLGHAEVGEVNVASVEGGSIGANLQPALAWGALPQPCGLG